MEAALVKLACLLAVPWIVIPAQALVAYTNWGNNWERGGAETATRVSLAGIGALTGLLTWHFATALCADAAKAKKK